MQHLEQFPGDEKRSQEDSQREKEVEIA